MKIFTEQERNILLLLAGFFLIGIAVRYIKNQSWEKSDKVVNIGKSEEIKELYEQLNDENSTQESDLIIENKNDTPINTDKININSADKNMLISLPKIGPVLADRILLKR